MEDELSDWHAPSHVRIGWQRNLMMFAPDHTEAADIIAYGLVEVRYGDTNGV